MTNSHNKIMAGNNNSSYKGQGGTNTERYFNNTSPPYFNGNGRKQGRTQRSPSTKCFNSKPSNNVTVTPSKGKNEYTSNRNNVNHSTGRRTPLGPSLSTHSTTSSSSSTGPCGSPPNFSHFAGSKCYDAPAPQALPKPPRHWTSCASEVTTLTQANQFDVFSHNLKSILNVQA